MCEQESSSVSCEAVGKLRMLHVRDASPVTIIGVAIDVGTRDERPDEAGMAHFVEHMMFKGTEKRKSYHIISRLDSVGGQLDAYTTKEETYVYATIPAAYTERALELLADVVLHSTFPEGELEKERAVVLDEIQSYNDSPSELIYDEFEELLFPNDAIGRNILGTEASLNAATSVKMHGFVSRCYTLDNMVVFCMGGIDADRFFSKTAKYFVTDRISGRQERKDPMAYIPVKRETDRDTCQAHCMIGGRCASMVDDDRLALVLLNNILGGPTMVSRLNLAVRERNGLCYTIESNVTNYTDTGVWGIYFGCDPRNLKRAYRICMQQLDLLCSKPLTASQLQKAKLQLRGQVLIGNQNRENRILAISKTYLHNIKLESDETQLARVDAITADELQALACGMFAPECLSVLTYTEA